MACYSLVLHEIGSENIAFGFASGLRRVESALDQAHLLLATVTLHDDAVIINSVSLFKRINNHFILSLQ